MTKYEIQASENNSATKQSMPLRSIIAALFIFVGIVFAPIAVLGTWARTQFLDTDRFVSTFAPLAQEPEIQALITDQVVSGIEEKAGVSELVGDIFDGLDQLGLPPRSQSAIQSLEETTVQGINSLIKNNVANFVASDAFANAWENSLRETHGRVIRVLEAGPNDKVSIDEDRVLNIHLGPVITEVKNRLVEQGYGFAEKIPAIDRTIPIVSADSFVLVRSIYRIADTGSYWFPWLVFAILVGGVLAARSRIKALMWGGLGLTISLLMLSAGLGVGKYFFVGQLSPDLMPKSTAEILFDQVTELMYSSVLALAFLSLLITVAAWLLGSNKPAVAVRGFADDKFNKLRAYLDANKLNTGGFGQFLDRFRSVIAGFIALGGTAGVIASRPVTFEAVLWWLLAVLLAIVLVEILRRPVKTES